MRGKEGRGFEIGGFVPLHNSKRGGQPPLSPLGVEVERDRKRDRNVQKNKRV